MYIYIYIYCSSVAKYYTCGEGNRVTGSWTCREERQMGAEAGIASVSPIIRGSQVGKGVGAGVGDPSVSRCGVSSEGVSWSNPYYLQLHTTNHTRHQHNGAGESEGGTNESRGRYGRHHHRGRSMDYKYKVLTTLKHKS